MKRRVAILISGGGSNMVALVNSMREASHPAQPVLVLSNNPDCSGLQKATDLGVPTAAVDHRPFGKDRHSFEARMNVALNAAGADIICHAGFMRITTPEFVQTWHGRMLNIHPSLLPKFKGLHPQKQAIEAGETESGCSVHEVTEVLDGGPILGQARVPVLPDDTPETLAARILPMEYALYPRVLRRFASGDRTPVYL